MEEVNWKTCNHEWSDFEIVREQTFQVAVGSKRTCKKCRAIEFENWCETRASGGISRIYPPEKVKHEFDSTDCK